MNWETNELMAKQIARLASFRSAAVQSMSTRADFAVTCEIEKLTVLVSAVICDVM